MSNLRPGKCGSDKIKRTNPQVRIYPPEFGYHPDIQNGFSVII
jgi:hypothetical protein